MLEDGSDLDQKGSDEHSKLQSSGCHSPKVQTGHMDAVEVLVKAPVARV